MLSILSPFQTSCDYIKKILGIKINKETIRQATEKIGKDFFLSDSEDVAFKDINPKFCDTTFLQIDGVKVNTINGWKEYKLALFYGKSDIKVHKSSPERCSLKSKKLIGAITKNYATELKQLIRAKMERAGYYWSKRTVLISDGAEWIENLFQSLFPGSEMILDWYHAIENLWKCAHDLFGENSPIAQEWVNVYQNLLWEGKIEIVLERLLEEAKHAKNQTPLRNLYNYYESRKDRMLYDEFRNKGYPIGSGAIESANSYSIQNRLKQSRMRWCEENANYVAHLRNKYFSRELNEIWPEAA